MNTKRLCGLALGAAIALGSLPGAHAQTPPAAGGVSAYHPYFGNNGVYYQVVPNPI